MKFWDRFKHFKEASAAWDSEAKSAEKAHPLKVLQHLPNMPGITPETAKNLKWKSIRYIIEHDQGRVVQRYLLKHPLRYGFRFFRSLFKKKPYLRDDDFFLYGIQNVEEFKELLQKEDTLLVAGFSYCHKPLECPSGRFTDDCIHDLESPVCRQCFIGKSVHALPDARTIPLFIPTIHYIGEKILELLEKYPKNRLVFLITACEMTLEMFGDFGNMAGIQGIGVRLDGRICNTMKAFELSEKGVKPGLTVVLPHTQERILDIFHHWRSLS